MGRIIHVEITSTDPTRTAAFFETALGWTSRPSPFVPDYLLGDTGPGTGIDAAVMSSRYQDQPVIVWFEVDDVVAAVERVERAGGRLAGDVQEIPGQGTVAYVTDPTGTLHGLRQPA